MGSETCMNYSEYVLVCCMSKMLAKIGPWIYVPVVSQGIYIVDIDI